MPENSQPGEATVILIGGPSGSGKTTLAAELQRHLGARAGVLCLDSYYIDWEDLPRDRNRQRTVDLPESIDWCLLKKHAHLLKAGKSVEVPVYSFKTGERSAETNSFGPYEFVILEGVLALSDDEMNRMASFRIYTDVDSDLCFIRRLQRDIIERGRSVDSVVSQYLRSVRPFHCKFVYPTRKNAQLVLKGESRDSLVKAARDLGRRASGLAQHWQRHTVANPSISVPVRTPGFPAGEPHA